MNKAIKLAIVSLLVIGVIIYWMYDRQQKLDKLSTIRTDISSTETKGWSIEKELQGLSADGPKYFSVNILRLDSRLRPPEIRTYLQR